jgi:hypothetical protein
MARLLPFLNIDTVLMVFLLAARLLYLLQVQAGA